MKKFWVPTLLLILYNFSCFSQQGNWEAKNHISISYVEGSNDPAAYEFSYERLVNILQLRTGLRFSLIPRYQFDEFGPKGIPAVFKNYSRQNLMTLEATPYLFTGRKWEQGKGFFLRAGPFITSFHLKYDKIVTLYLLGDRDVVYNKVDKYIFAPGISGATGYQFAFFRSKERFRIETGGRVSFRMNEPVLVMFKISTGICF